MKTIHLKVVEQKKEDGSRAIVESWKDVLIGSLRSVNPQSPPNLEEMGEKIALINKVKSLPAGADLTLENSEFRTLAAACAQPIWNVIDEDIYECLSTVKKINEGPEDKVKK